MSFDFGPTFLWSLVLGTVGLGYFMYGKKLQKAVPLGCGLVLMVFPYFVEDTTWLAVIGGTLSVVPWIVKG
jgi:hypothetical protein